MRNSIFFSQSVLRWVGGLIILFVLMLIVQGQRSREPQMGWEYLLVSHKVVLEDAMEAATEIRGKQRYFSKEAVNDERLFDMLGKQGWELVYVEQLKFGESQFIFKRLSF